MSTVRSGSPPLHTAAILPASVERCCCLLGQSTGLRMHGLYSRAAGDDVVRIDGYAFPHPGARRDQWRRLVGITAPDVLVDVDLNLVFERTACIRDDRADCAD